MYSQKGIATISIMADFSIGRERSCLGLRACRQITWSSPTQSPKKDNLGRRKPKQEFSEPTRSSGYHVINHHELTSKAWERNKNSLSQYRTRPCSNPNSSVIYIVQITVPPINEILIKLIVKSDVKKNIAFLINLQETGISIFTIFILFSLKKNPPFLDSL